MNLLRSIISIFLCGAVLLLSACSNDPESVATKDYMANLKQSNSYAMFGAVQRLGRYSLATASSRITVSQSILRAGGFCSVSHKSHVVLRRGTGKLKQRLLINVDAIMRKTDASEDDPTIKAGDVIIVYSRGGSIFGF
ncbi:MAG: hypothetical protein NTY98_26935 [Verrucomicrobia bacterium]|nr:hypothetical protein [Verrucomicrobiota bacterium]